MCTNSTVNGDLLTNKGCEKVSLPCDEARDGNEGGTMAEEKEKTGNTCTSGLPSTCNPALQVFPLVFSRLVYLST